MRSQEVVFSLAGQSFFYDPPEGRPSGTPTVQVFLAQTDDDSTAQTATTGACSVDSVNTTLSVAAAIGASTLTVTSGTGITRGTRYLLTDADGDREWVECISITGTTVGLRRPLLNAYAITVTTFQGCRISISVDSTWSSTKGNISDILSSTWQTYRPAAVDISPGTAGYRLRWAYTANGTATIGVSYADLVRYQAKNLVTPVDVDTRFPGWIDRLAVDYIEDQGASLIEEAFYAVKMDALADAQVMRRIRNTEVLRDLVVYRANLMAAENDVLAGSTNTAAYDTAHKLYAQRYDSLIREPKIPVDQTGGGSAGEAVRLAPWRR